MCSTRRAGDQIIITAAYDVENESSARRRSASAGSNCMRHVRSSPADTYRTIIERVGGGAPLRVGDAHFRRHSNAAPWRCAAVTLP